MKLLVTFAGPTAAGKTAMAVQAAHHWAVPVIAADSRQIYQEMNLGTSKPTAEELALAPHRLTDLLLPGEMISAGRWAELAEAEIRQQFETQDIAILCGGSGLYLHALWHGLDEFPEIGPEVREQLNAELETRGLPALVEELRQADPATFATIDRRNPVRVIRALEVFRATGSPISAFRTGGQPPARPWRELRFLLEMPREALYARIDARMLDMVAAGLPQEVRILLEKFGPEAPGLQSVGYREFIGYWQGEYSLDEAIRLAQRNTRHLAKRQMTWFRRYPDLIPVHPQEIPAVLARIREEMSRA